VAILIDGLDIEAVGVDGSPLRRLVLDPTKEVRAGDGESGRRESNPRSQLGKSIERFSVTCG
jgi:hypothetical protein